MRTILFKAFCIGISFGWLYSATAQTWIQWSSTNGGNNHYYASTTNAGSWVEAETLAESWGGTLATITSSNEQQFINHTFLTGSFEQLPIWIGLMDPQMTSGLGRRLAQWQRKIGWQPKANLAWITGEPLDYTNWKPDEPSNSDPGEYFVAINWEFSDVPPRGIKGDWNDTPLNGTKGFSGKTDGPYFGLVERNTDPSLPTKSVPCFNWTAVLFAMAAVAGTSAFIFSKRRRVGRREGC